LVDVKGDKETGRKIAGTTIERAEALLAELAAQQQDAEICLQLLRDNINHWREEAAEAEGNGGE
jgi:hypothetical protein